MNSYVSEFGNDLFMVSCSCDVNKCQQWIDFHYGTVDESGLWPIHFHSWLLGRSEEASIKALWQGRHIALWLMSKFALLYYAIYKERVIKVWWGDNNAQ